MCSFTESPLGLLPYAELLIWLFLHSDKPSRLSLDGLSEFNMEEHWSTPERIVPPVPTIGHEKNTIMEMKFINHVQNHMGDLLTLLFPGNSHVNISELYCLFFGLSVFVVQVLVKSSLSTLSAQDCFSCNFCGN